LAGMILGPSLFGIIRPNESLEVVASVAVFFLMLLAGLEMDLKEVKKAGRSGVIISLIAFTVPFLAGIQVASLFGLSTVQSVFMGLLLSITALPVSAIVLMEFGILKSKIGNTVMTAAVINDILALAILGIIVQFSANGGSHFDATVIGVSVIKVAAYMAVFFISLVFGKKLLPKKESNRSYGIVSGITLGFFAPLFFGFIGIKFNAQSILELVPLFVALLAVAIATKIGGGFIGAKIVKFSNNDALAIGALMNGRGMIELAIASIGLAVGILDLSLFSIAVAIGFVTTMLSPLLARPFVNKAESIDSRSTEEIIE
ncbi:MAG: cation:proton antiporter, partial [Nitrososphaeraceae archaeon]